MVETDPVSDLVSRSASQVEAIRGTSRKGREENNDSIILGGGLEGVREGSITEETRTVAGSETNGVNVEGGLGSTSESLLHLCVDIILWSGAAEPPGVQCPGGVLQLESEASSGEVLIQDVDLILELGVAKMDDRSKENGTRGSIEGLTERNLQR